MIARLWWLGWLLRTVPDLVLGALLTLVISALLPARHRLAARLALGSLTVALTIMLVRPFVRLVVLVNVAMDGQSTTTVVPTGLMPVTVHSLHGIEGHPGPGPDRRAAQLAARQQRPVPDLLPAAPDVLVVAGRPRWAG